MVKENQQITQRISTIGRFDVAVQFFDLIRLADDARDDDLLESLQFTVFGLGNKTYEHYNQQGKFFNKRLAELGAKRG